MHLRMKRKWIAAVLAVAVMLTCVVPAFASSLSGALQGADSEGIYIATTPVPVGATSHARASIAGVLCNERDLSRVTLGTPFTVQGYDCDLYYFPVMYDGSVVGTYRVFALDDGRYTGIYAEDPDMAAALNALADTTGRLSPARIVVGQYEDLYAVTPSSVYTVLPDYADRVTPVASVRAASAAVAASAETVSVVDVSENIGFVDNVSGVSDKSTRANSRYLTWTITETQSGNNWCGAYATAAICRYVFKTNSYTALGIMQWHEPTVSLQDLKEYTLSLNASVNYGRLQGLNPQRSYTAPVYATIKAEIDSDCPVYFYGERINATTKHAFVCRGYNLNSTSEGEDPFYSVWNPTRTYCETVYAYSCIYAGVTGYNYEMTQTIIGWE